LFVFGKVLEGIMVNRLKDVLPRTLEDAWRHVVSTVVASQAKYMLGIFVDFKGAFDHVEWDVVMKRLIDSGCREASLWRSFFSGRSA